MISKAGKGSTIAYWIGAAVILMVFVGLVLFHRHSEISAKSGVEVLLLGDSVLAQSTVGELLAELGPYEVANCAIGGTTLSAGQKNSRGEFGDIKNPLRMVALVRSIQNYDFGPQKATRAKETILNYLPAAVATLDSICFEQTQVLVFNHGINDYHSAVKPDNPENPMDIYTFGGALRQVLTDLQKSYPELRIIYMTPPYSWYEEGTISCEEMDFGQGTLDCYVDLALEICREYGVEVVDIYHGLYDVEQPDAAGIYTLDGLHPNKKVVELIAHKIAEAIAAE